MARRLRDKKTQIPPNLGLEVLQPRGTKRRLDELGDDNLRSAKRAYLDQQPQQPSMEYVDGPARFIAAKDGSKSCLALLVTEQFIIESAKLFEHRGRLITIQSSLGDLSTQNRISEQSIERAKKSLESANGGASQEKSQANIERQETLLQKNRHRKNELERERVDLRTGIDVARAHTDWVLEEAMKKENLLKPKERYVPHVVEETEQDEGVLSWQDDVSSRQTTEPEEDSELLYRRKVYDDLSDRRVELDRAQFEFDNQEREYDVQLQEYKRRYQEGRTTTTRSEFDRRIFGRARNLTGHLIKAEEAFEEASKRERALDAAMDDDDGDHGSASDEHKAVCISSIDRKYIEMWRARVAPHGYLEKADLVDFDDVDDGLVDIGDSWSAVDQDESRKSIDQWQRMNGTNRQKRKVLWPDDDDEEFPGGNPLPMAACSMKCR